MRHAAAGRVSQLLLLLRGVECSWLQLMDWLQRLPLLI
jgi:hypothetical protein